MRLGDDGLEDSSPPFIAIPSVPGSNQDVMKVG